MSAPSQGTKSPYCNSSFFTLRGKTSSLFWDLQTSEVHTTRAHSGQSGVSAQWTRQCSGCGVTHATTFSNIECIAVTRALVSSPVYVSTAW
eukprot:scaffold3340_cov63-Phaeocystis_antarctica.AAC.5